MFPSWSHLTSSPERRFGVLYHPRFARPKRVTWSLLPPSARREDEPSLPSRRWSRIAWTCKGDEGHVDLFQERHPCFHKDAALRVWGQHFLYVGVHMCQKVVFQECQVSDFPGPSIKSDSVTRCPKRPESYRDMIRSRADSRLSSTVDPNLVRGQQMRVFLRGKGGTVDREDHSCVPLWRRGGSRPEHSPSQGVCGGVSCV